MSQPELNVKNVSSSSKKTMVGCRSNGNVIFAEEQVIESNSSVNFKNIPEGEFEIAISVDGGISDGRHFSNYGDLGEVTVEIYDNRVDFGQGSDAAAPSLTVEESLSSSTNTEPQGQTPPQNQPQGQTPPQNQPQGQTPPQNQPQNMGQNSEPSADEQYCHSCGDIIKNEATICPSCGVSTDLNSSGRSGQSPTGPGGRGQQSYGLIFSIIDSWKYQKAIRHLINIALITVSVGTYLVVLLIEGLIHYRNLNNGNSEPYDESKEKVWTTFTDVQ